MTSLSCPIVTIYESCSDVLAMLVLLLMLGPGVMLAAFSGILLIPFLTVTASSKYITILRGETLG